VVQLYDALLALAGSPVVAINRALRIAEMHGPLAALASRCAGPGGPAHRVPYRCLKASGEALFRPRE
jgi:hypothetical protein